MRKAYVQQRINSNYGTFLSRTGERLPRYLVTTHSRANRWNMVMNPRFAEINFGGEELQRQLNKRWIVTISDTGYIEVSEYVPPVNVRRTRSSARLQGYKAETNEFAVLVDGGKVHVHKVGCECQSAKEHADDLLVEEFDTPEDLVKSWMNDEGPIGVGDHILITDTLVTQRMQLEPCMA